MEEKPLTEEPENEETPLSTPEPITEKAQTVYRFMSEGRGVFYLGRKNLPEHLLPEILKVKGKLPKPNLPDGDYEFWLKQKGKEIYLTHYKPIHDQYLENIIEETKEISNDNEIVYEDEYQVAFKSTVKIEDKNHPYKNNEI